MRSANRSRSAFRVGRSFALAHVEGHDHRTMIGGHHAGCISGIRGRRVEHHEVRCTSRVEDVVDPSLLRGAERGNAADARRGAVAGCYGPRIEVLRVELGDRRLIRPGVHVAGNDAVLGEA